MSTQLGPSCALWKQVAPESHSILTWLLRVTTASQSSFSSHTMPPNEVPTDLGEANPSSAHRCHYANLPSPQPNISWEVASIANLRKFDLRKIQFVHQNSSVWWFWTYLQLNTHKYHVPLQNAVVKSASLVCTLQPLFIETRLSRPKPPLSSIFTFFN